MKITRIEAQKKNRHRLSIYLDGDYAFGVDREVAMTLHLCAGMEVPSDWIEEVLRQEEQHRAHEYALSLLTLRDRSEQELRHRMSRRGYQPETIEPVIVRLSKAGLVDDRRFAAEFAREKAELSGYGRQRIAYELAKKGIAKDVIAEVVVGDNDDDDEYLRAEDLARNRLKRYRSVDRPTAYRRLAGFLQRKGYTYSVINRVLRELLGNPAI